MVLVSMTASVNKYNEFADCLNLGLVFLRVMLNLSQCWISPLDSQRTHTSSVTFIKRVSQFEANGTAITSKLSGTDIILLIQRATGEITNPEFGLIPTKHTV